MFAEILEVLKTTEFNYYAFRGQDEVAEMGEVLEESYYWNYDFDRTTKGYDDEERVGGTCVTGIKRDMTPTGTIDYLEYEFDTKEEAATGILKALEWYKKHYYYQNVYLVGGDYLGNGMAYDDNELILEAPKVLLKLI